MKYILTDWDEPKYNMALEELLMEDDAYTENYFFFYIHRPSVIIGKNQNVFEEVNLAYTQKNGVIICRRQTGGGAVYHDEGNLNFSFVQQRTENTINFEKFTSPVICALEKLGVHAVLSGRNDILVGQKKISGNSQRQNAKKTLHHGTILFDVDLEKMVQALTVREEKFVSKAVKSVRSRVMNVKDALPETMSMGAFKNFLLEELTQTLHLQPMVLDAKALSSVTRIAEEKYASYQYTFQQSPPFSVRTQKKFPYGFVCAELDVHKGIIRHANFTGDFFFSKDIAELQQAIFGKPYSIDGVKEVLSTLQIGHYIDKMTPDDFLSLLFSS